MKIRLARSGFTLIEILVVIVVIAVLAGMVAPNVFKHVGEAKNVTARSQIEMLGAALDSYRLDTGRYPTTSQGLAALWKAPSSDGSRARSEEHTSELQSPDHLVCRLLLEKKKRNDQETAKCAVH